MWLFHFSFFFNPAMKLDLGSTNKPNHHCKCTTKHKQQDLCTLSSLVEDHERMHTITYYINTVSKEYRPLLYLYLSGKLVTFLADTGQTTSTIRPQDLVCSCKACRETVESEGIKIDLNGQIIQHPFIVSSRRPLSTLGQDVLRKYTYVMKSQQWCPFRCTGIPDVIEGNIASNTTHNVL